MYTTEQYLLAAAAALMVGFSKTGLPGTGILVVPIMALIFASTRESIGLLLPMLIVGDIFAVAYYKRHAQWKQLWRLFPWVAPGMAAGYLLLLWTRDKSFDLAPLLGAIVLALVIVDLLRMRYQWVNMPHQTWFVGGTGTLAGFTTTVGNAAGSIMNIYFLSLDLPKAQFVGTAAWFFMIVNLAKVPIFVHNDMITTSSLGFDVLMIPAIAVGAVLGILLLPVLPQKAFNLIVRVLAAVAALKLIIN